jgi:hypothetical protein
METNIYIYSTRVYLPNQKEKKLKKTSSLKIFYCITEEHNLLSWCLCSDLSCPTNCSVGRQSSINKFINVMYQHPILKLTKIDST